MRIWLAVLLCVGFGNAAIACGNSPPELLSYKPLVGPKILLSRGFGAFYDVERGKRSFHPGIDWWAPKGATVTAAGTGRVINVTTYKPKRHYLAIDHGNGWITGYGALARGYVAEGDCVKRGMPIGVVAPATGAQRPRLHFEVFRRARPVDPLTIPRAASAIPPY